MVFEKLSPKLQEILNIKACFSLFEKQNPKRFTTTQNQE